MDKFKKLIADDIEIKCPVGHSSDGTFYKDTSWIDGASRYADLLEKALKGLKYMTEDYDCDPADVADFDKREAEITIAEITAELTNKGDE